jgi:hypothetical protein
MSFIEWWMQSESIRQLGMRDVDVANLEDSFLYRLSENEALSHFRYVLLVGSVNDFYVPIESAILHTINVSNSSRDSRAEFGSHACFYQLLYNTSTARAHNVMTRNILHSIANSERRPHFIRYVAYHNVLSASKTSQVNAFQLSSTTNLLQSFR